VVDYQEMLSKVNYEDYDAEGTGRQIVLAKPVLKVGRVVEESQVSDRTLLALGAVSTAALVAGFLMRNTRYLERLGEFRVR